MLLLSFHIGTDIKAQSASKLTKTQSLNISNDINRRSVHINFSVSQEIESMLVLITDEKGNIVFLENKHRFKGEYSHDVDLKNVKGSRFEVQIRNDNDEIKKTLSML